MASTDFCKTNTDQSIPSSVIRTCDASYGQPTSPAPANVGSQSQKTSKMTIEISNYAANLKAFDVSAELASKNTGPRQILMTLFPQSGVTAVLKLTTNPVTMVTLSGATTTWISGGKVLPLPAKNNECGNTVGVSFLRRLVRVTNRLGNTRYIYSAGENGHLWGSYLMQKNPQTLAYNQSYTDFSNKDYHISVLTLDAMYGVTEVDSSAPGNAPTCFERDVQSIDYGAPNVPDEVTGFTVAFASEDFYFGNVAMRSHPVFVNMAGVYLASRECAKSISQVFELFASHEIGHFLLDSRGHQTLPNQIMSQKLSCSQLSLDKVDLPYTSATIPEQGIGSEYLDSSNLESYCAANPRGCKTISELVEQRAREFVPNEDFVVRWRP